MSAKVIAKKLSSISGNKSFLKPVFSKNSEQIINYNFGCLGSQFQENLKQQWLLHCTSNSDIGFFTHLSNRSNISNHFNFTDTIKDIKDLCDSKLPFGIARIENYFDMHSEIVKEDENKNLKKINGKLKTSSESKLIDMNLKSKIGTILQSMIFVSPVNSRNLYFQWQRQRKIWWSRFSVSPGHYSIQDENNELTEQFVPKSYLSEISSALGKKTHAVNIVVDLETVPHCVEMIELFELNTKSGFQMGNKDGQLLPHIIISTINLEAACLGILAECLDENGNIILHHKLAPFQYRIVCDYTDMEDCTELTGLAQYLCGLLRKSHLRTLFVINDQLTNVLSESDKMGIPYCLILRKEALRNGFIHLRNRDTTLEEQIHVSDVPSYLVKLCTNF